MNRILTGGTVLGLALAWGAWATAQAPGEQPPQDQQQQDRQRRDQDQPQHQHHARGRITAIGASAAQAGQSAEARRGTFITVEGRKAGKLGGPGHHDADRDDQARRDADRDDQARRDDDRGDQDRPDRGARTTFLLLVTDATRIELAGAGPQPNPAAANPELGAGQPGQPAQQNLRGLEVGQRVAVEFRHLEGEGRRDAGQPGQDRGDRDQADPGQRDRDRDQDQARRERTIRGEAVSIRVLSAQDRDDRDDDDQDRPAAPMPGQAP
jgi:hypothetical protein